MLSLLGFWNSPPAIRDPGKDGFLEGTGVSIFWGSGFTGLLELEANLHSSGSVVVMGTG